jgi:hypothetical protein
MRQVGLSDGDVTTVARVLIGLTSAARRLPSAPGEGWSGRRGSNPRPTAWKAVTLPLSYSRLRASRAAALFALRRQAARCSRFAACRSPRAAAGKPRGSRFRPPLTSDSPAVARLSPVACQTKLAKRAKSGGEGRIRTSEAARATDLQSAAFDRSATSPAIARGAVVNRDA